MLFAVSFLSFFLFFLSFVLYLLHAVISDHYGLRPSQGFLGTAEKGIYFRGTGEQRPNFEGTGETKQYWGTGNIRKRIFDFLGTGEQANLFQGNKGTGTLPGRASL